MDAETLRRYLEYYQDLGIKTLYRRAAPADPVTEPRPSGSGPLVTAEPLFKILDDIGDCRRCRLHEQRNKIVFGVATSNPSWSSWAKVRERTKMRKASHSSAVRANCSRR